MKTRLLVLWLVQYAAAMIWEFGSDVRGTSTIAQSKGKIASWDSITQVPLPVPTCMDVKYVHVHVKNMHATPVVTYNKHIHTVYITFNKPPSSHSKYEIMATGKRQAVCDTNTGGGGSRDDRNSWASGGSSSGGNSNRGSSSWSYEGSKGQHGGESGGGGKHHKPGKGSKRPRSHSGGKHRPDHSDHAGDHGKSPKHPGDGGRPSKDTNDEHPRHNHPEGKRPPHHTEPPRGHGKKPKKPADAIRGNDDYPNHDYSGGKHRPDHSDHSGGHGKRPKHPGDGGRPSKDTNDEHPRQNHPGGKRPPHHTEPPRGHGKKPKNPADEISDNDDYPNHNYSGVKYSPEDNAKTPKHPGGNSKRPKEDTNQKHSSHNSHAVGHEKTPNHPGDDGAKLNEIGYDYYIAPDFPEPSKTVNDHEQPDKNEPNEYSDQFPDRNLPVEPPTEQSREIMPTLLPHGPPEPHPTEAPGTTKATRMQRRPQGFSDTGHNIPRF